ncbi:glutamate formimidoyltransferase [bacterium]|nr:glutamate formimidoyltransferase [bacterium]
MLLECVPNFSEGRDARTIEAIAGAALSVRGVALLDAHRDPDHNRSVLTLAGAPDALAEAVFRSVREAVSRIDLRSQQGEHPRVGAADVIPFVPLEGASMELAVTLARRTGERIARELSVPVFFYEEAAQREDRRALPDIRNQGFLELSRNVKEKPALWKPDLGPAELHPSAGASCVGARFFLVAWNVDLESEDLALAKEIARGVRESSGGFPGVRAKAFRLASQRRVQVSLNLVDYRKTSVARAFLEVERLAQARGARIARSELVGLIPEEALEASGAELLRLEGFRGAERVLERRLREKLPPSPAGELSRYLAAIASREHAPGGGSAGALAAALGRACLEKARLLSSGKGQLDDAALAKIADGLGSPERFLALAQDDERAFADLAATWALPKGDPRKKEAAEAAIATDLRAASAACELALAAARVAESGNPNLVNDAALACELALACVRVARWNALATRSKDAKLRADLDALLALVEGASERSRKAAEAR